MTSRIPLFSPFRTIWGRHFLFQTMKIFFFFLTCFYGLYVLIDFTSHATHFHHGHQAIYWKEVALYYLSDFARRMEVFIPFALLISTVKVLCSLNIHNELVALMASGIPLKTLLRPFLLIAMFCVALLYLNTEWLVPRAMHALKHIEEAHQRVKRQALKLPNVQHLILEDESTLLFQHYDSLSQRFFNAYWIRSIDDVWHMETLDPYTEIPTGYGVDWLLRNPAGQLTRKETHSVMLMPAMRFNKERLIETLTPAEELPLGTLWEKHPPTLFAKSEKEAQIMTALYYKMSLPWLCLLAVIAPAPFCVAFTRQLPVFFIYACGIFGLVAFYLLIDAAMLLGKRQLLTPWLALGFPFFLFFGIFSYRYWKI
ncbi:MAG: LptF/LptG family permease [Parachlamydia sp.]|nr:LptF/LptG family permease [Parachlamydia sp.]